MNPIQIIEKYYSKDSRVYHILVEHSKAVAKKAIEIAKKVPEMNPNLQFIEEAAMLHDIGIFLTNTPKIHCYGKKPYICHGHLGKELLEKEGLPKHALVCERHIGVGLSKEDIIEQNLPLPKKDIMPKTIEEEIICFADNFFKKTNKNLSEERTVESIRQSLSKLGKKYVKRFDNWIKKFKIEEK